MGLILQIFGAAFLLLIGLLFFGILFLRYKLKRFARFIEESAAELAKAGAPSPARIHLRRLAAPDWADPEAVEAQSGPLPELGFSHAGDYQIEEVPGLSLAGWVNAKTGVFAVVYEHPQAGVWTDVVTRYVDGTRITYANTLQGSGVEHSPGHDVQRFDGIGVKDLYEKHLAARPDKPIVPPSADEFVARFEKAYADEMDWRNSRGGATEQEIRQIALQQGRTLDEDEVRALRSAAESRAMEQLAEAVRERFLEETRMPAREWEDVRDRVVVVHDRMSPDYFEEMLSDLSDDEEDLPEIDGSPGSSPRNAFARYNAALEPDRRYRKLGTVTAPVEADVYAAPEYADDDEEDEDDD
ncbi:MAG: hypothetical protein U0835_22815 [Isosphaeraceae bacterium]